jgi:hypothetical protein
MKTNRWLSNRFVFIAAFIGLLIAVPQLKSSQQQRSHSPATRFVNPKQIETTNPKVTPGLVHWTGDFEDACRAAQRSGKPVLLFQVLGRLDERFC